ncbi:MAG: glycosyltransferase family 4 protein [Alsobacter sp.]
MSGRPRVLFVNHSSTISGAELVLLDVVRPWAGASALVFEDGPLAPALAARSLTTMASRWGRRLAGIRRDSNLLGALPALGALAGLGVELLGAARRHDVIYANSQKAFVLSALCAGALRRPLIWHLHDIIDPAHFGRAQRLLQIGLANRFASRVVVPSRAAADAFVAAGGRAGLVTVIPNGIDAAAGDADRATRQSELGLPPGRLVGVFSRLARWKGQHVLLEALADLPSDVKVVMVGAPLFGEDAYALELDALVKARGLGGRVVALGQRADVPALMQAMDVVVHPSIAPEPFGRTLVEAMLAGTPVVATDAGAAREILADGACGVLAPPADPAGLARALRTVLSDPVSCHAMVERAGRRAREVYGTGPMLEATADLIVRTARGAPS